MVAKREPLPAKDRSLLRRERKPTPSANIFGELYVFWQRSMPSSCEIQANQKAFLCASKMIANHVAVNRNKFARVSITKQGKRNVLSPRLAKVRARPRRPSGLSRCHERVQSGCMYGRSSGMKGDGRMGGHEEGRN